MQRVVQIALVGLLLSATALCCFGCYCEWSVASSVREVAANTAQSARQIDQLLVKVSATNERVNDLLISVEPQLLDATKQFNASLVNLKAVTAGLNSSVAEINAPCHIGESCGTLADVNRTLGSMRLAAGQVTAFSLREQTQVDAINKQEVQLASQTSENLEKLGTAIDGVNDLVRDPHLRASMAHIDETTSSVALMANDTQKKLHDVLHPIIAAVKFIKSVRLKSPLKLLKSR